MAEPASLKRLGGGRWQTRDGRFTVEPQSGTWVVVDGERTDELGLPLVRGPFSTLTAAKADIEMARSEGETDSPLAARIAATSRPGAPRAASARAERRGPGGRGGRNSRPVAGAAPVRQPKEPAWLRALDAPERDAARKLIERLTERGVEDAASIVRSDIVADQPAIVRLAIQRRIEEAVGGAGGTKGDADVVARVVDALLEGQDRDLGVRWRLVDGEGRAVRRLDGGRGARR